MKRISTLLCSALLCTVLAAVSAPQATAQTAEENEEIQDKHENENQVEVIYNSNVQAGDQYIRISLGAAAPLSFGNPFTDGKMHIGGVGTLGYHRFITDNIAIGGDASFGSCSTIGGNIFNFVPIIGTFTYQFSLKNFEFPLTLGLGFAWETYSGKTYWPGLVVKPQAGVHYRITSSWSLGGDFSYLWMPQFNKLYDDSKENKYGQFFTLELVARYYF